MQRRLMITCLFLLPFVWAYSQKVSVEDSLRLKKIFSESNEIELNEETKEAIRKGTLISPGFKLPELMQEKKGTGLLMPEVERPKENNLENNPLLMPSYVFWLYEASNEGDSIQNIRSFALNYKEMEYIRSLLPGVQLGSFGLYTEFYRPGATFFFSAEDILRTIFWPTHRAKKRNAKHANAWRHYNMLPQTGQ